MWWKVGGGQDWKQVQQGRLLPGHTAGAVVKVTSSFPGIGSAALAFLVSAGYEGGRVNNGRAFNHPTFSSFKKKKFRTSRCLVFSFVISGGWDLFDSFACPHASVQRDVCVRKSCGSLQFLFRRPGGQVWAG